jgi:hypothetical protein
MPEGGYPSWAVLWITRRMRSGKTKVLPLDLAVYRNTEIKERFLEKLFDASLSPKLLFIPRTK